MADDTTPPGWVPDGAPLGNLLVDTDVRRVPGVPGRWAADLPPAWNVFYVFGGVTMATALRAAARELDRPDLRPLTAHAVYCSPIAAGPVEADVTVIRDGRSASNVRADLRQAGKDGVDLSLTATFGQVHDTHVAFEGIEFPSDVLPPEQCPSRPDPAEFSEARNPFPAINFHAQTDFRPAMAGFSWTGDWDVDGGREPRFASWLRLLEEPRLPDGTIDPISYCVPADMLGTALGRRMGPNGPDNPPFLILSLEIDLQLFATTDSPWILQHTVAQWAGQGYGYGTTELWDEHRRLVGFASQRARLRPFSAGEQLGPR